MVGTPELLFSAIEAGVRLARSGQSIFLEQDGKRELAVALPTSFTVPLAPVAKQHAERVAKKEEERFSAEYQSVTEAVAKGTNRKESELQLIQLYLLDLSRGLVPGASQNEQLLAGLAALRIWEKSRGALTDPLQRVASTLVDGVVQRQETTGSSGNALTPLLEPVLRGLADCQSADPVWDSAFVGLFNATLDQLDRDWVGARSVQSRSALVRSAVSVVIRDLVRWFETNPDNPLGLSAIAYASLVLGSVLSNVRVLVLDGGPLAHVPGRAQRTLVSRVGSAFVALLLENGEEPVRLVAREAVSTNALDRLVRSTLILVGEYPGYFRAETRSVSDWLRHLFSGLCQPRKDGTTYNPNLILETAVVLLEDGLRDLPALAENPSNRQLFVLAMLREMFEFLSHSRPEGLQWRDALSRSEIMKLVRAVLGAWTAKPDWLYRKPSHQEKAATLLPLLVQSIAEIDDGSLRAVVRFDKLSRLLGSVMVSGLSSKLSSFNAARVSSLLNAVLQEMNASSLGGWDILLERGRLEDLLTAISFSKAADRLFGEDPDGLKQAARHITLVAQDLRKGQILSIGEMTERLNKGK